MGRDSLWTQNLAWLSWSTQICVEDLKVPLNRIGLIGSLDSKCWISLYFFYRSLMNLYLLANLRKLWYQGRSSSFPVLNALKMGKLVPQKLVYPKLDGFPAYLRWMQSSQFPSESWPETPAETATVEVLQILVSLAIFTTSWICHTKSAQDVFKLSEELICLGTNSFTLSRHPRFVRSCNEHKPWKNVKQGILQIWDDLTCLHIRNGHPIRAIKNQPQRGNPTNHWREGKISSVKISKQENGLLKMDDENAVSIPLIFSIVPWW